MTPVPRRGHPPNGETPAATEAATVTTTEQPPQPEAPAPDPEAATEAATATDSAPSLDAPPYAETHEPDGWPQPKGRPPLGDLAEQSAPKED